MEDEIAALREENETLKKDLYKYKVLSDTFEKRLIDLQMESVRKDEEIKQLKTSNPGLQYGSSVAGPHDSAEDEEVRRKVFVGGLSPMTTTESLTEFFSQFGTVVDSIVMKDPTNGKSRGFGFVVFSDASMVDTAQEARPHKIDGKIVDTKRAVPRGEPTPGPSNLYDMSPSGRVKRIFVGGLKSSTEMSVVEDFFAKFGQISSVETVEDKVTRKRKGFAYVTYNDYDSVDKACQQRYYTVDGRRVEVKRAVSKLDMLQNKPRQGTLPGMSLNMLENLMGNFVPAGANMAAYGNYGAYGQMMGGGGGPAGMGGYGNMGSWGNGDMSAGAGGNTAQQQNWSADWAGQWIKPDPSAGAKVGAPGPMRPQSRFAERSTGPYGSHYGPYGSPPNH